jgi:hypothetical protein
LLKEMDGIVHRDIPEFSHGPFNIPLVRTAEERR